jgi:hypothetical protein
VLLPLQYGLQEPRSHGRGDGETRAVAGVSKTPLRQDGASKAGGVAPWPELGNRSWVSHGLRPRALVHGPLAGGGWGWARALVLVQQVIAHAARGLGGVVGTCVICYNRHLGLKRISFT